MEWIKRLVARCGTKQPDATKALAEAALENHLAAQLRSEANALVIMQPEFYVVSAMTHPDGGWIVRGVFTRQDDAEAYRDALNLDPIYMGSGHVNKSTMELLLDDLVRDRLGVMAGKINRIIRFAEGLERSNAEITGGETVRVD